MSVFVFLTATSWTLGLSELTLAQLVNKNIVSWEMSACHLIIIHWALIMEDTQGRLLRVDSRPFWQS